MFNIGCIKGHSLAAYSLMKFSSKNDVINQCLLDFTKFPDVCGCIFEGLKYWKNKRLKSKCEFHYEKLGDDSVIDFQALSGVPALLVYKNKELIGNFIRLSDEFGTDIYASDVESFLDE